MLEAIAHRGPDGHGVAALGDAVLGACRLVVVDPTDGGSQPMATDDGRHHLVFNGELYDHAQRRNALAARGERFRSRSDTEVLLRLLARDGERVVNGLKGMFAFAWWDADSRRLVLARDRFGEKPLFYAQHDGRLWFASEEKALFAAGVPCAFAVETWPELLLFRHVAGERTPYEGVRRLLPGHLLEVVGGEVHVTRWWTGPEPDRANATPGRFRALLDASVRLRLQADVPVGVLLSGGLDSSAVARLASRAAAEPVHAFTVCYPGHRMDEGHHARLVAEAGNLRHHEVVVDAAETPALLEDMTRLRGEPLTHAATTHLLALSRVAREHVKVLVSGEGADELLGGYGHYQRYRLGPLLGPAARVARVLPDQSALAKLLRGRGRDAYERILFAGAYDGDFDVRDALTYRREIVAATSAPRAPMVRRVMSYEQHTHLQSVLDHADRATMGVGLECRLPFLDADVANAAAGARTTALYGVQGKRLLRRAMAHDLPQPVLTRRKAGWSAPWMHYLREVPQLRELVRSLPSDPVVRTAPIPATVVDEAVSRFLDGRGGFSLVWMLVRVAVWHEVCVNGKRVLA